MYQLSEAQIDYMLRDIQDRGIEMESLQQDLLDHVCCLIEENLEPQGNFESYYAAVIGTFYKKELREIEEETLFLLANKNYYAMKKIMLITGAISAIVLSLGILFKFMHWPGAGIMLVLGIAFFSLLFLPLVFVLKVREKEQAQPKFIWGVGILSAILFSMSTLFKIMHWPGANILGLSGLGLMLLLFLPVYFFTGIRNPETKMNALVTSILIVAASGLLLALVRSPGNSTRIDQLNTSYFLRNELILKNEQKQVASLAKTDETAVSGFSLARQINRQCEALKAYILEKETGLKNLEITAETNETLLPDGWVRDYFKEGSAGQKMLQELRRSVEAYNQQNTNPANPEFHPVPVAGTVLDKSEERTLAALNGLTQIQLMVLQNQQLSLAAK